MWPTLAGILSATADVTALKSSQSCTSSEESGETYDPRITVSARKPIGNNKNCKEIAECLRYLSSARYACNLEVESIAYKFFSSFI